MGQQLYWNFLKASDLLVGNSSSGIIEAPFLKIPTLNIGDRQKGRIFTNSIYSCEIDANQIYESIISLLYKKKINYINCFEKKNTITRIYNLTKKFVADKKFKKNFYDI
jgi:GDP/UDP-N,N'-diacetylbacillosamine 2-epimerase (hydrolysing)